LKNLITETRPLVACWKFAVFVFTKTESVSP
jgi:hypothetical protein